MKFKFMVTEYYKKSVEVEAETEEAAKNIVYDALSQDIIQLDSNYDYADRDVDELEDTYPCDMSIRLGEDKKIEIVEEE